jgi:DNA-binding response OmpR family regulator
MDSSHRHEKRALRVMLFEDNSLLRSLLATLLAQQGWQVLSFPDPVSCPVQHLPSCRCERKEVCADAIVTDLNMPHMDGCAFIRNLLDKGCKMQHIAMLTTSGDNERLTQATELGCKVFGKPEGIDELVEWLRGIEANLSSERKLSRWIDP